MQRLTSLSSFRLTLLGALGVSGALACSGSVTDHSNGRAGDTDGGTGGSAGSAAGRGGGGGYVENGGSGPKGGSGGYVSVDGGAWNGGGTGNVGGGYVGGTGNAGGAYSGGASGCLNPTPLPGGNPGDPSGGFVQCEGGKVHRPQTARCWEHIDPEAGPQIPDLPDGSVSVGCTYNKDCAEQPHGYCGANYMPWGGPGPATYACAYGCVDDSECGAGQICLCGEPVGRCVEARCHVDGDCDNGYSCEEHYVPSGCGSAPVFSCGPLCVTNEDCPPYSNYCGADGNCLGPVCGRPFLVDGASVLAEPARRGDWSSDVSPDVSGLSAETRRALARHYTDIALMEHASVAAFARFSLELLSMGAPAELVEETTAALADETRHARVCFGLAAAYGGKEVGPGPLATDSALSASSSVAERVETAFLEACVGETLAAIEVAESALRATDPAVKALLSRIAEDETRHAALGFKFVKWALAGTNDAMRAELTERLWAAFDGQGRALTDVQDVAPADPALVAHGMLSAVERRALREAALTDVVAPCVRALLGPRTARRAA
ncbi:MAG TPA: ferritin-like domain-containing protein [Polyangiaceae bacterium]|nr:ferritin-like domain-containing protein [Polyangiaceae bacterium]